MGRTKNNTERVELVYRAVHPSLWPSLLTFTGNSELASDAEAEAFAQVLRRGDQVNDVAAWVWAAAFRIASALMAQWRDADPMPSGEATISTEESSVAEFLSILGHLSEQQRACVVLRYLGGFNAPEIAKLLSTTDTTVRVQLHRAHASLRLTLKEAGYA